MSNRPGTVTFIGVLMMIQAAFSLAAGIVVIFIADNKEIEEATGLSKDALVTSGWVTIVTGVIVGVVASLILTGSRVGRALVAVAEGLAVIGAAYVMFTHHDGAFLFQGLLTVAWAMFVLWALFNERADAYFENKA
jgi:hypothetical protein